MILLAYGAAVACIGKPFLPPSGPAWCVLLVWTAASLGGLLLSRTVPIFPALLGQIAAGILLRNLGKVDAVAGLPKSWSKEIRYGALAIIFLRSGLEQDLGVFRRVGPLAVRLLLIPGITEALVSAGAAVGVFGMKPLLALCLGFILKPVDPAIVLSTACAYSARGAGTAAGIPSLIVAAGSFDDLVALIFFSIFSSLAITSEGSLAWSIASAPLQIVFGAVAACVGTLLCSATRLWSSPRSRTAAVLAWSLAAMFAFVKFEFSGAGILAAIGLGVGVGTAWTAGWPRCLSSGPLPNAAALTEHHIGAMWEYAGSPLLFGLVGTLVDHRKISAAAVPRALAGEREVGGKACRAPLFSTALTKETIPSSLLVIFAGWAARMPATFLSVSFSHLTWREKLFVTLAWLPKATVQAALATAPLDRILAEKKGQAFIDQGENIVVTCLLAVLVCGPLGVLATSVFGPRLVPPDAQKAAGDAGALPPPPRRLPSDAAAALAGAGAPSRRRPASMLSLPAILPAAARSSAAAALATAKTEAAAAAAATTADGGGGGAAEPAAPTPPSAFSTAAAAEDEDEVDASYEDALLADVDPELHNLVEAVDLEAWLLDAGGEGGDRLGAAEARAAAARLRAAAAGLRRRLVEREPGTLRRVDGARDFFARLDRGGSVVSLPAAAGDV